MSLLLANAQAMIFSTEVDEQSHIYFCPRSARLMCRFTLPKSKDAKDKVQKYKSIAVI